MSISGISSNSSLYDLYRSYSKLTDSSSASQSGGFGLSTTAGASNSSSNTMGADLNTLLKALESGNLSTAQSSFSQLLKDAQAVSSTDDTSASTSSTSSSRTNSNPLAKDMSDLGDAISSGDLTGAQSILANIMQHMQGPPPPPPPNESTSTSATSATSTTSASGSSSLYSNLSALEKALSSGDQTSAQNYFSQLLEDLQSISSTSSSSNSTVSTSDSSTTTSSNFSLQLGKLMATWASLMGTNTQLSTTNIFA